MHKGVPNNATEAVPATPSCGEPPKSSKIDPMDEIANTTESASRIGEGKSTGYGFSSSTTTFGTTEFDW
eukprot:CAMPEP_0172424462 /NCGR_PEP_ID=MMETSP1064-20121228/25387_1 /TAXON_ID=202472 /ORGANISM="Aulacoseira subarctica , Strain CCAP 1002/5" /LENGTH=68 /DNA_ID=CAMNT_0013166551 /DNA_START=157 /DNA_END=360 /DNA_ORIENTATION=-